MLSMQSISLAFLQAGINAQYLRNSAAEHVGSFSPLQKLSAFGGLFCFIYYCNIKDACESINLDNIYAKAYFRLVDAYVGLEDYE